MDTKRITQWTLSNKDAQQMGVDASFEKMADELIERDINYFIKKGSSNNIHSLLLNTLNDCFAEVENEFNSDRWISLSDEIYFDKKANGCWVIRKMSTSEGLHKQFMNNSPLDKVTEHLNNIIKDPINQWEVPNKEVLTHIHQLDDKTPFEVDLRYKCIPEDYLGTNVR